MLQEDWVEGRGEPLRVEELAHIDGFLIDALVWKKERADELVVAKPYRIILLYYIAPDAAHRLYRLLLRHSLEVLAQNSVAHGVIRSINVITACQYHVEFLFTRHLLHQF